MGLSKEHPGLPDGVLRQPYLEDGRYRFEFPLAFSACKAVALRAAADGCRENHHEVARELGSCVGPTVETRLG